MEWHVHDRRPVYESPWVEVWLDDVELPDGQRIEHHELRFPRASVTAVVVDGDRVLLLLRHRFITNSWGWEVPQAGLIRAKTRTPRSAARSRKKPAGAPTRSHR